MFSVILNKGANTCSRGNNSNQVFAAASLTSEDILNIVDVGNVALADEASRLSHELKVGVGFSVKYMEQLILDEGSTENSYFLHKMDNLSSI